MSITKGIPWLNSSGMIGVPRFHHLFGHHSPPRPCKLLPDPIPDHGSDSESVATDLLGIFDDSHIGQGFLLRGLLSEIHWQTTWWKFQTKKTYDFLLLKGNKWDEMLRKFNLRSRRIWLQGVICGLLLGKMAVDQNTWSRKHRKIIQSTNIWGNWMAGFKGFEIDEHGMLQSLFFFGKLVYWKGRPMVHTWMFGAPLSTWLAVLSRSFLDVLQAVSLFELE